MVAPLAELAGVLGGKIGQAGADIAKNNRPGFFTRLFTDPLFLSVMSGTATALHPGTKPINDLVQKAVGGQSMGKVGNESNNILNQLVGKFLRGEVPDNFGFNFQGDGKGGIKLQFTGKPTPSSDEGGAKATSDPNALNDVIRSINTGKEQGAPSPAPAPAPTNNQINTLGRYVNPFGSGLSGLSNSDLAVLGPEGVMQALMYDLNRDQLSEKTYNDLVQQMLTKEDLALRRDVLQEDMRSNQELERYRRGDLSLRQLAEERQWVDLLRMAPLEVPGLGRIPLKDWNALDTKTKAYAYYAFNQQRLGQIAMDYNTWEQQESDPTIYKYYQLSQQDPAFKEFYFEATERGATRITLGEKIEEKVAFSKLQGLQYFDNPKWLDDVAEQQVLAQRKYFNAEPDQKQGLILDEVIRYLKGKIKGGNGVINEKKTIYTPNSVTWFVKFPESKEEKQITYAY